MFLIQFMNLSVHVKEQIALNLNYIVMKLET